MEDNLLKKLYLLVKEKTCPNRSNIIQEAVKEKHNKIDRSRLAKECAKMDTTFEQSLAEEGFSGEMDL